MRKLAIFAWAFALAAAAYVWLLPSEAAVWLAVLLTLFGLAFLFLGTDWAKRIRIFALGMAIGLLWSQGYEKLKLEPLRSCCGTSVQVTAEVCREPQATQYGTRVQAAVDGGQIMLYLECKPEELSLGDKVHLNAEVVDVSRGSGDENNLYYQSKDISLLGFQRGELTIEPAEDVPLRYVPQQLLAMVREKITELFPEDTEGFALALLTGERDGMTFQQRNNMSLTGIAHIVSVSGMHVTLIVGVIQLLCLRRRRIATVCSLIVMLLFAAMLGFSPSVTRAVTMNTVFLLAPLVRRENDGFTSLGAALLVILLHNPWAIANVSLQLSFVAMAGIFLVTPRIFARIMRVSDDKQWQETHPRRHRMLRSVAVTLAATLGANSLTLPLVAMTFGSVSVISPLTNMLLMPVISLVFTASFVLLLVALVFSWLAPLMFLCTKGAWLLSWLIRFALWAIDRLAGLPYAAVYTCSGYITAWLALVYALSIVYVLLRRCKLSLLLGCVLTSLVGACVLSALPRGTVQVTAFDVGQGQCIFLRNGDTTALIDCGGDEGDYSGEEVARRLLMAGERSIDALILTHYDTDHICGMEQLLSRIEVNTLILPQVADDSGNLEKILSLAEETPTRFVQTDVVLQFGDGTLNLLAPDDPQEDNASLSVLMSVGEYDILVTGDLSTEQELTLLRTHELPDLEVLVAGHHGSKNSTSAELLTATRPDVVIISVGDNRYGHPAAEVLERIAAVGAAVYRTDLNGEITLLRD